MAILSAFGAGCAHLPRPPEPSPVIALSAPTSEFTIQAPAVKQTVVGCVPCAMQAIEVNGLGISALRQATQAGLVTFFGRFRPGDRIKVSLYRRMPCR